MYVDHERVSLSLLLLRLGVFVVMFMWTLDKFYQPEHAAAVFDHFYGMAAVGAEVMYVIGTLEMLVLFGFLIGAHKTLTYGLVLAAHAVSTLASWRQYLSPFEEGHLLFFAAWPMLAACLALFILRAYDTKLSVDDAP